MSTSALKFIYFRALGFEGAMPEMELAWLQSQGTTADQLSDAWYEFLSAQLAPATPGHISDMRFAYFRSLGHTGSRSDMENQYWRAAVDSLP